MSSDLDPDSGQPESLSSLSASASTAKGHDRALRSFYAAQKHITRETNKRRGKILQAQAARQRRSSIAGSGQYDLEHHEVEVDDISCGNDMDARLNRRMTCAMGDAEEETTEQVSGSESGKEWGGIKSADPKNFQSRPADEDIGISGYLDSDGDSEEDCDGHDNATQSTQSKYLPDELFAVALAKSRPRNGVRPSQTTPKARPTTEKRRRPHPRAKDVVVGWVLISYPSQSFCSMNKSSFQYTHSSHPVTISSSCTWSDPGTRAYQ